jgi:hypothetical protein
MVLHRLSKMPPSGPVPGKGLSLCGRYLHPLMLTIDGDLVGCSTCLRATGSARTIERDRIATTNAEGGLR